MGRRVYDAVRGGTLNCIITRMNESQTCVTKGGDREKRTEQSDYPQGALYARVIEPTCTYTRVCMHVYIYIGTQRMNELGRVRRSVYTLDGHGGGLVKKDAGDMTKGSDAPPGLGPCRVSPGERRTRLSLRLCLHPSGQFPNSTPARRCPPCASSTCGCVRHTFKTCEHGIHAGRT
jgi:hypothetical protein